AQRDRTLDGPGALTLPDLARRPPLAVPAQRVLVRSGSSERPYVAGRRSPGGVQPTRGREGLGKPCGLPAVPVPVPRQGGPELVGLPDDPDIASTGRGDVLERGGTG